MKRRELESLTRLWQGRLRLQDWFVKVRFAEYEDEITGYGQCQFDTPPKEALIIVKPEKWRKAVRDRFEPRREISIEETVIHELCHLHTAPFMDIVSEALHPALVQLDEHAVDPIAYAIWASINNKWGD